MKKASLTLACLLMASALAACGQASGTGSGGGIAYRVLYSSEFTTLDYVATSQHNEYSVLCNTVDGLVDYDTYGQPVPALAESWEASPDFMSWTFKIRKGVPWVNEKGEKQGEVTAHDFVAGAQHSNEAKVDSGNQYMYEFVKNAFLYFDQSSERLAAENAVANKDFPTEGDYYEANGIDPAAFIGFDQVGVKAADDYTLVYEMEKPCPFFLSCLSYSSYLPIYGPFLAEHESDFGVGDNTKILYCGAYVLSEYEPNVKHVLTKNALYWDAANVAIDRIERTYNAEATTLAPTMAKNGELDYAEIGTDILDAWMNGEGTKSIIHPTRRDISFSYFYNFNFEPRFDEAYEPGNWTIAVNNESFRKSIFFGLDRVKAISSMNPFTPQLLLSNTVTPTQFALSEGVDYTQEGPLAAITARDSFSSDEALAAKALAMTELSSAGCTFPVKVLMPYNPSITDWDKECQVVEQQLEGLLGKDYIDVIVEAGPSTAFLGEVRRSGKYALMKCNWGADYADPQTWTEPFSNTSTYGFFFTDGQKMVGDRPATSKTAATQALAAQYYGYLNEAKAQTSDISARHAAFAKAEAFLIDHAFFVPFSVAYSGYVVDRLDTFSRPYAPFGVSQYHYKGAQMLESSMGPDEFAAALAKWESEWAAQHK
jgi:oligopeptide transport system substrate-binding protein